MRRITVKRWQILLVLALLCAYVWSFDWYYESQRNIPVSNQVPLVAAIEAQVARTIGLDYTVANKDGLEESSALIALLKKYEGKPLALDTRTQSGGCRVEGPLPDSRCSPGAVFASATVSDICTSGYSRSVRSVSVKTKQLQYEAYGLDYPQPTGSYEMDHLIPLELGGSNDVANLFPEAAEPVPGFHEKDLVENYLHDEVCAGVIELTAAQEQIARDWVAVYDTLTPSTISALKRKIASYLN